MKKVELRNLVKFFGETKAVDNVSLSVNAGEIFGLVGRNGAGKTTTIRMLMDIYVPDSGDVLYNGAKRPADFHTRAGYLPEERGLYPFMTVIDNLLFLAEIKGVSPAVARPKAMEYLRRFDLEGRSRSRINSLSKGNQQKVQFVGTILHDPDLVVLDEPFSGLDPVNSNLFKELILELKRAGKMVILSTHQMDIAERMCDHIALINKGQLVLNERMTDVKRRYSQSVVSLEAEGNLTFIESLPYVVSAQRVAELWSIQVRTDPDIQELLGELLSRRIVVRKFNAHEMSLHDVFVSLTQTPEEARAAQLTQQSEQTSVEAAA